MNNAFRFSGTRFFYNCCPRIAIFIIIVDVILLFCGFAHSTERNYASLEYVLKFEATDCPSEQELKNAVAARLGYFPWTDAASLSIEITILKKGEILISDIILKDDKGNPSGERHLQSNTMDCRELAESTGLAVGMILDPLGQVAQSHATENPSEEKSNDDSRSDTAQVDMPTTESKQKIEEPSDSASTGTVSRTERWSMITAIGGHAALMSAPHAGGGIQLSNLFRKRFFSLGVGVRYDFFVSKALNPGKLKTSNIMGQLYTCAHHRYFFGCGLMSVGALVAETEGLVDARRTTQPAAWVSMRISGVIPVGDRFQLYPFSDASVVVVHNSFHETTDGDLLWKTPSFHLTFGLLAGFILFK